MWDTPLGERTLEGAEACVFAGALHSFLDDASVWDVENYEVGIAAYDHLTYGQKMYCLWTVAQGLLCPEVEALPRTAALDASVAVVFWQLEAQVTAELEMGFPDQDWRDAVAAAYNNPERPDRIDPACQDWDTWDLALQALSDAILGDNDYDTADIGLDLPPEQSLVFKSLLGISDAYNQTIPEDWSRARGEGALHDLREFCLRVCDET